MSAPHVSEDVDKCRELFGPERVLKLAVVVEDGQVDCINDAAENVGGEVLEELPSGVLIVSVPTDSLDGIISTPSVLSVSMHNEMEILE